MKVRHGFAPQSFASALISSSYERVFHEEISDEVKSFLGKLSYVAVGMGLATAFSFAFNVLAGRTLGPSEYGQFTLVQSIAMFMYVPMLLGFGTAMVRYAAQNDDEYIRSRIVSTTYILTALFTIISVVIYFSFSNQLASVFSISNEFFYLTIAFAVLFMIFTLTVETLRGLDMMRILAIFQPAYAGILLLAFLMFILWDFLSFRAAVYSMFIAYGVTCMAVSVLFLRKYLTIKFDKSWANTLGKYGMFAVLGGLSFVMYTNIDRILINRYMTVDDVGIYRAYFTGSVNVMGLISATFVTVFFPAASRLGNKQVLFRRIDRIVPYLVTVGVPFALLAQFITLKFYGEGYPVDSILMGLFSITSVLVVWYGLLAWTFNSEGVKGVKLTVVGTTSIAFLNVLLNICMIPHYELYGAIGATMASFTVGILLLYLLRGRIV